MKLLFSHIRYAALLFVVSALLPAVISPAEAQSAQQPATVDVFLDCQAHGCDTSHFRNEIAWVNWVRDRTAADVHLLITSQGAGGGGSVFQLSYIGLRAFARDSITLTVETSQQQTDAERRDLLTNRIAQGLLFYASRTSVANSITVVQEGAGGAGAAAAPASTPESDPWNSWVFVAELQGSMDGESREGSREVEAKMSANRVTAATKFEIEVEGSYERDRFQLRTGEQTYVTKNWQVDALATRAMAAHWSTGFTVELGRSTFENQDFYTRPAAILEYSLYPYDEFSRRRVLFQYSLGARHAEYAERTIYDRISEQRFDQQVKVSADFQQPWGSAGASLTGSHYLHDLKRYRASADARLNVRLVRGLSLNVSGSYARVHDQLFIPAGDADDEEVLLRRRALETNYRYRTSIGLRYAFGSIYNNVVNPRVGSTNQF